MSPTTEPPRILETKGIGPADHWPDPDDVYKRACVEWRRTQRLQKKRCNQFIVFDKSPVCIVFAGDQHLGDEGTDVPLVFAEAEIIRDTPGVFAVLMGDSLNNFVIGKLRQARDKARLSIMDEWALVKRLLEVLSPKLLAVVSGNHENWTYLLAGIDYFAEVLSGVRRDCIYDTDDSMITFVVDGSRFPARIRHKWKGSSIYNPTHGIERGSMMDQNFLLGVGAHTHVGGVARDSIIGGQNGLSVQVGSYKRHDEYAKRGGFAQPNRSTAVAVLLDADTNSMTGFSNLTIAQNYMRKIYG